MTHWTFGVTLAGVTNPPGSFEPSTQPYGVPVAPVSPPPGAPYPPAWPTPQPPRRSRTGLIVGLALVGLLVLGGAAVGVGLAVRGSSGPSDQQQAISACETAVKAQLKSPATAGFSGETTSPAGSGFYVEGNVDAQNGFGALIRTHWTCSTSPATNGRWLGNATLDEDN